MRMGVQLTIRKNAGSAGRCLQKEQKGRINRRTGLKPEKLYPQYRQNSGEPAEISAFNTAAEDRRKMGFVTMLKSISEIAPYAPFGKSKTTQLLKDMGKKGVVKIEGRGRGTKYMIK